MQLIASLNYVSYPTYFKRGSLQRIEVCRSVTRPIPLSLILMAAFAVHLPLLLMKLPLKSYDTNFHIFFASHYVHHWFDPWNAKWYAGFSQTTYPPLPQQWVALISRIIRLGHGIYGGPVRCYIASGGRRLPLLLALGESARGIAGRAGKCLSRLGKLPGLFCGPVVHHLRGAALFECPALSLRVGPAWQVAIFSQRQRAVHGCGRRSPCHAALRVDVLCRCPCWRWCFWIATDGGERTSTRAFVLRTVVISLVVGAAIAVVLLPFWIALIHNPVTQTPIPHPSRANYILSPQWGLNYFVVPYGALILALPFIVLRGSAVVSPASLAAGLLGGIFGGTRRNDSRRPSAAGPRLRSADHGALQLLGNFAGAALCGAFGRGAHRPVSLASNCRFIALAAFTCALAVAWSTYHPADAADFKVDSVAAWLNRDGHDKYRYITLGFGNKISRLAVLTDASSVDGEWNSGRMLPELTQYGAGPLTSSKYFGKAGLDALRAMLYHADRYGLKWVFVRIHIMTRSCHLPAGAVWTTLKTRPSPCGAKTGCHRRCP